MKQKLLLPLLLVLLTCLGVHAQSSEKPADVVFTDFSNATKWSTMFVKGANAASSDVRTATMGSYTVSYANAWYSNTPATVVLDKTSGELTLPAFNRPVSKIQLVYWDNAPAGAVVSLYEKDKLLTTFPVTNGETGLIERTQVYDIPESDQYVGAQLVLKNLNPTYRAQMASISVWFAPVKKNVVLSYSEPSLTILTDNYSGAYPELSNPDEVKVTYSSSNTSVATVDPTGKVTLIGNNGSTVIKASFAGNSEYYAASASYTLAVANPADGLPLVSAVASKYADASAATSINNVSMTDDSGIVKFVFSISNGAKQPQYVPNFTGIRMYFNDVLTISLADKFPEYYIEKVVFTSNSSDKNKLTQAAVTEGTTFTGATGTSKVSTWDFANVNLRQASLTFNAEGALQADLTSIVVYLRKPILKITAKQANLAYTLDSDSTTEQTINLASYFTVTGEVAAYPANIIYKVNDTVVSDGKYTVTEGGDFVVTASCYNENYEEVTPASFNLNVTTKTAVEITYTGPDTLKLYVENGIHGSVDVDDADNHIEKPEGVKGTIILSKGPSDAVIIDGTKVVANAPGEATIEVTFTPSDLENYVVSHASFTIKVVDDRKPLPMSFDKAAYTWLTTNKGNFVSPEVNLPEDAKTAGVTLGWNSSNTDAATVDADGTVSLVKVGQTIITASFSDTTNATYKPASASYTLVYIDPTAEDTTLQLNPESQKFNSGNMPANTNRNDISGLVNFSFNGGKASVNPNYNSGSKLITLTPQNVVTITANDGYYLNTIEFVGNPLESSVVEGATYKDGKWVFDGSVNKATVTYNGTATAQISNIIVTLKKGTVIITPATTETVQLTKTGDVVNRISLDLTSKFTVTVPVGANTEDVVLKYSYTKDDGSVVNVDGITMTISEAGTYDITATFAGNATLDEANASYEYIVVEQEPLTIAFDSEKLTVNYYGFSDDEEKTIDAFSLFTVNGGPTPADLNAYFEFGPSSDDKIFTVSGYTITLTGGLGTATLPVFFRGNDTYAVTKASCTINVIDGREKVTLSFSPDRYSFNTTDGTTFTAPEPIVTGVDDADKVIASLGWKSSDGKVVSFNDDKEMVFADKHGIFDVTITAFIPAENSNYQPAQASYTLRVIGPAYTVSEYLSPDGDVSGNVKVRGYIIGSVDAQGNIITKQADQVATNIAIAGSADATSNYVVISLQNAVNTSVQQLYNVKAHPEYIGSQVIVTGTAATVNTVKGVNAVSAVVLYQRVNYTISATSVPGNYPATISVPSKFDAAKANVQVTVYVDADCTTPANTDNYIVDKAGVLSVTFKYIEGRDNKYFVKVQNDEIDGFMATEKTFDVTVTEPLEMVNVTFYFAQKEGDENIPAIYVTNNEGTLKYTTGWKKMEFNNSYLASVNKVYKKTISVAKSDVPDYAAPTEDPKANAKKKAPVYDEEDGKYDIVSQTTQTGATQNSALNVYISPSGGTTNADGTPNLNAADVVKYGNVPVGDNVIMTVDQPDTDLIVFMVDAEGSTSNLGSLQNNSLTDLSNLFKGSLTLNGSMSNASFIFATQANGNTPAGTIYQAAALTDGAAVAANINQYSDDYKDLFDAVDWDAYYDETSPGHDAAVTAANALMKAAEEALVPLAKLPAGTSIADANKVNIALKDLNDWKTDRTNTLYINVEIREPFTDDKGNAVPAMYNAGFSLNPNDISTDVNEVEFVEDADVMWFNLQGERIAEPSEGIVIRVQGNKSQKILIRK